MSVRERVRSIRAELRDQSQDVPPVRLMAMLLEMTALLGNCTDEVRRTELAYNDVLLKCLALDESANRAEIRAKCSEQYAAFREAKDVANEAVKTASAIKAVLRAQQEEMRLAR